VAELYALIQQKEMVMTALFRPVAAGLIASGILACLALSSPVQAGPWSGTFTYGGSTTQSYVPTGPLTALADATQLNEGTDQSILALSGSPGAPGAVGQFLVYANVLLNVPAAASGAIGAMTVSWGAANRFSFVSAGGTYARDHTNEAINFLWGGVFTDSLGVFSTQFAQVTQGWTQANVGLQPSVGGTLNSDPTLRIPEPAGIAMFGVGLLGLGFLVRRRSGHDAV
jgi:hypothetical protein